jgi:hypothetical protein
LEKKDIIRKIKMIMDKEKEVSKELKEIQDNCTHKDGYDVKFLSDGSNDVRRVCKTCGSIIGYPTDQELIDNGFK